MSETIAEIKITIKDDQVVWDIGNLDIPNVVFWLEEVKFMILAQVRGDDSVVRTTNY
jgi:hypothetical protein